MSLGGSQAVGGFFALADAFIELGTVEAANAAVGFDDFAIREF